MGDLTHIEPLTNDVIKTLRERLDDALKGNISGIVILCEYEDAHTIDMPGAFSMDIDDLSNMIGKLTITSNYFASMAFTEDEDDYE